MKKLLVIVLALLTILCLVACDSADAPADTATPGNTEATTTKAPVTTDEPDDDDDDTPKTGIDYRDELGKILEKNAAETLDAFAMNVNMTVGMNFVTDGMNSNNTIPMEFSFVMNKSNAFYANVSSTYLFNTDEPLTMVCVDGMVYRTTPDGELIKASATEEDIKEMLGLEEMPSFSTDISEMIPEEVWDELPPKVADALKSFKLTDLFKEVKLTSSKNGKRVITCTGLNAEKLPIYSESTSVEGDGETPVTMPGTILDALDSETTAFSLSFTVNAKDQIIACGIRALGGEELDL